MSDRDVNKDVSANATVRTQLLSAWMPIVERLEGRRLFATTTIQTLPFTLDFSSDRGELLDKDGQGTGFTRVQANENGTEYQDDLIDLDTAAGVLRLTTTGTSTAGSNSGADNTLVNGLETQFNATTSGWSVTARLIGPLGFLNNPSEQGGIMFGPDQDNWVKLVAVSQPAGQKIQFIDEQTSGGVSTSALAGSNVANTYTDVGSFSSINTLDLRLVGDAATGKVQAYYAINGGSFVKIAAELTLSGAKKDAFFNAAGRAGLIALHKNDVGPVTVTFDKFEILGGTSTAARPTVTASRPANGATNVSRDSFVAADVNLTTPGAGVDAATLTSSTVKLYRTSDGALVNAVLNTSGGGDAIVLTPTDLLAANTNYTFEVTTGLKDTSGNAFMPFTMSFTTGNTGGETDPSLAFEKVGLGATGKKYSSVKIGPDGKLYATTIDGLIQRFTLNSNGTIASTQNITSLQMLEGGQTFLTGIAFDPASTSTNIIIWATHSQYAFENATDWTGKISRISGANLETAVNKVVGLPRSIRDHVTNQPSFGPDGAIYLAQGSMTALGAPDNAWGMRSEHLLSAAILRLDTSKLPSTGALNVKTESGGTYNPFAAGAALTLYATGVRNAYDLVWTSDGRLYAAANGSAAGGNTPAGDGAPALSNVQQTHSDFLFLIQQGGYYGHPNPTRGEYVLNGGNPTSGVDPAEVPAYPVGTMPDSNWRGFAYDFGRNWSPNGTIQYSGSAFGGTLNGRLVVARYSGGDDLLILQLGADGKVTKATSGVAGLTHYVDPLDVAQHPTTGHLYVAEFGGERLTLVRAIAPGANIAVDKPTLYFNDTVATGSSPAQTITIRNTGTSALAFPSDGISITGADGARFSIVSQPAMPFTIQPGQSVTVSVRFTSGTTVRIYTAKLVLKSNDPDRPTLEVDLRGLGTAGTGGANEPSLQRLMDLFQIPINVGDANPDNTSLYSNLEPLLGGNDELTVQRLIKAGTGPVTIQPIAMMGVSGTPAVKFGYYRAGTPGAKTELFTIGTADAQSVNPTAIGTTSFDPGSAAFGLYSIWPWTTFKNPDNSVREIYSEDSLNRYENTTSNRRKIRFYALRNADGSIVPNAYVMAHEEFINNPDGAYDNQDIVAIIRNVQIAPAAPVLGLENRDGGGALFPDRLVFNRIDIDDANFPNGVHDVATLRINNTGNQALNISSMSLTGSFAFVNSYTFPLTIGAGSFLDVQVRFTQTASGMGTAVNGIRNGTLTINSNDPSRPTTSVALSGHWQLQSERTPSPGARVTEMTLADILNVFGYTTSVPNQATLTATGNGAARLNDEILSGYWQRAESSMPVKITQLVAFHTQGNTERIATHLQGSTTTSNVFVHSGADGQSFLPHLNGSTTALAAGYVSTAHMAGVFGFRAGNQWSDDSLNPQDTPGGGGRFLRIFVAKDRSGNVIPNTYLICHDYFSTDPNTGANTSNFDFQDNIYLVENIRPANDAAAPAEPTGLTASGGTGGNNLDWANNTESDLAGYNVYRSSSATGTFTKLNTSLLTSSNYLDQTAPSGATSFYRITAVDAAGNESAAATISAARPTAPDTTPPAAPANLTASGSAASIFLNWNGNIEADLAGYNVYRASSAGGPYTLLNTLGLVTASDYTDTTAPSGATSFYRVTAVDDAGNESAFSSTSATRPSSGDTTAPAAPAGQTASPGANGIAIDWVDNIESDLAGYNVYRSSSASGPFTKLNASLLTSSSYLDQTAPGGTSHYRITAVDASGNESASAAVSATRTTTYTGVDVNGSTPPGSHTTLVEGVDYNITAGGANIGGTVDSFYFNYRQLSGDFDMRVRLDGLTKVDGLTRAGLMARESLTGDSRNAFAYATPDNYGDRFSYRPETGAATSTIVGNGLPVTYPNNWLRLKRQGNTFNAYKSTNGTTWTLIGSATVNLPSSVFFGLAVSSRSTTKTTTAQFRSLGSLLAGDTTPPGAPSGLVTSADTGGIDLNWDANTESDLAGYNVYRSSSAGGAYTKLNTSLLSSSDFSDTTAPAGATSFYRVTAVDASGNESTFASTSATRPGGGDTTAPAVPTGVTTTTSTASIVLNWADNVETDLAGYNIYRSSSSGGTYTKLNTAGLLTTSAYTDTTAPSGATSFYRITAVDSSGNESAPLSTSATRPSASVVPSGPIRINFQLNGSPAVSGWAQDNGNTFGTRANGWQYGWNADHTDQDRDRNVNSNQLLDTLVQMEAGASWSIDVANGVYEVKVSVGDSRYATTNTINVNGANYWTNAAAAANAFLTKTVRLTVTNGRITINNGAAAHEATRINYVEIIPVTRLNFQLNGSPAVAGYTSDFGDVFGARADGRQYGWSTSHTDWARDRNRNSNQLLDTLVHFRAGANWQMAVANGTYQVKVSVGDSQYSSRHTINVNGVNFWTNAPTEANRFLIKTLTVTVTNGRLKFDNGASIGGATRINFVELRQVG